MYHCLYQGLTFGCVEAPRAFWRLFKADELGRFEKDIQECKSEVDAEICRALHQTIYQEQQLQLIDREAAAGHRDIWNVFRVRVDKSNEEELRWRIQTDERKASAWLVIHLSKSSRV